MRCRSIRDWRPSLRVLQVQAAGCAGASPVLRAPVLRLRPGVVVPRPRLIRLLRACAVTTRGTRRASPNADGATHRVAQRADL
jgi:hypothetical protein